MFPMAFSNSHSMAVIIILAMRTHRDTMARELSVADASHKALCPCFNISCFPPSSLFQHCRPVSSNISTVQDQVPIQPRLVADVSVLERNHEIEAS